MKRKDEQKVAAIFEATIVLTGSVGIAGLKMSDIAKTASIASGTLYTYFRSKEELLNALFRQAKKETTLRIIENLDRLPIKRQLFELWKSSLQYRVKNQATTIFLEQFVVSPFITSENKALSQQLSDYTIKLLEEGKRQLIIKNISNEVLLSVLTGYLRDLSMHLASTPSKLNGKTIQESFTVAWDAIKS